MNGPNQRRLLLAGLAPLLAVALGGCPVPATLSGSDSLAPATYWIERDGDELRAIDFPDNRSDDASMLTLDDGDVSWFIGDGLYSLDDSGAWSLVEPGGIVTLDAWMQTYDPPPATE